MKASRVVTAGTALAACGVLGMAPAAVQASSAPDPAWMKQAPASHPSARDVAAIAYDAATGTVVLFGGDNRHGLLHDTWTWDGTTWTKQNPATSPPARGAAAMAYDAATGTIVLFGGEGIHGGSLADTWTWDGTTWTKQHPATSPPRQRLAATAYDAATATVVLFSGLALAPIHGPSNDTWTWDGTTWTEQHPATSPPPQFDAAMAYDAATRTAVLFGGDGIHAILDDTWTWG